MEFLGYVFLGYLWSENKNNKRTWNQIESVSVDMSPLKIFKMFGTTFQKWFILRRTVAAMRSFGAPMQLTTDFKNKLKSELLNSDISKIKEVQYKLKEKKATILY